MELYRITLEKYSYKLVASGSPARWNSRDIKVIYTASSRALACLENVVHRSALGLQDNFRTMIINVPDGIKISDINLSNLKKDWQLFQNYPLTQAIGDEWAKKCETLLLKVPSAIVSGEFNYLINPLHADFRKIKLVRTEAFEFDSRIKK